MLTGKYKDGEIEPPQMVTAILWDMDTMKNSSFTRFLKNYQALNLKSLNLYLFLFYGWNRKIIKCLYHK